MDISKLKEHEWKIEEAGTSSLFIDLFRTCYLDANVEYGKNFFSTLIYSTRENYCLEAVRMDEVKDGFRWVLDRHLSDPEFFKKKKETLQDIRSELENIALRVRSVGLERAGDEELLALFDRLHELGIRQYGISIITETADSLSEEDHRKMLPDEPRGEKDRVVETLTSSVEHLVFEREKISLLEVAILLSEFLAGSDGGDTDFPGVADRFPEIAERIHEHVRKYFWIQNGFAVVKDLDGEFFFQEAKRLVQEKTLDELKHDLDMIRSKPMRVSEEQQEMIRKHALSDEAESFYDLIRTFAVMQDLRKECVQREVYCVWGILDVLSRRKGLAIGSLYNYLVGEIRNLIADDVRADSGSLAKRPTMTFYSTDEQGDIRTRYLYDEAHTAIQEFLNGLHDSGEQDTIKGFVASKGDGERIFSGRIRIILNAYEGDMEEGEILVAGMTRPEYVPLMKKAKAIITNEGGITSHAAIIAREMKKPCIIGTKVATRVLHDGDLVEVDADNGVVRILERAATS
jgi:phosphohistidine swiveling domain-containing protein